MLKTFGLAAAVSALQEEKFYDTSKFTDDENAMFEKMTTLYDS